MPTFAIALMGFLAFSGGPVAPVEVPTIISPADEASTKAIVRKDETKIVRAEGEDSLVLTVKLTSYNAVPEQTDANPLVTASGAASNSEVIAARSVDLAATLPYGTVVAIIRAADDTENCHFGAVEHLIGYRVIADSMHSRKRNQVDVMLNQDDTVSIHGKEINPSLALGMCSGVSVKVIGKIKLSEMPRTQEELQRIVEGKTVAFR